MLSSLRNRRIDIWIALVIVYLGWGSSFLAIRLAIETIPPFLMGGIRSMIAGGVLYAWQRARGAEAPTLKQWRAAAVIGFALLVLGNGGIIWAEQWVASGVAALLNSTVPLWMILIDAIRPGGRRPTLQSIASVPLGFCGVAVLIGSTQRSDLTGTSVTGAIVVVVAALFWSLGSLYSRKADLPDSPVLGTGMQVLAGGVGLAALGLVSGEWSGWTPEALSTRSLIAWAYLVVIGSGVTFVAYTWLLRSAPTPLVATYAYVNPIVAVALGYFIATEPLTWGTAVAAVLIVGSVVLTTRGQATDQVD